MGVLKEELNSTSTYVGWLVGWLVVLRINVDLAIFQSYLDLEAGDNKSLTSTYVRVRLTQDKPILPHVDTLMKINVKIDEYELAIFYWLPKLHKNLLNPASYQVLATALLHSFKADYIRSNRCQRSCYQIQ